MKLRDFVIIYSGWMLCTFMPLCVYGHGRLIEPPSRASMWRYGYNTPPNYSDNQLFCGGFAVQWNLNKGKCGVCGDPWQGPREHEAGGKYANGIIVRRYDVGSVMTAIVQITASHLGYFEFRLCPVNNPQIAATWDCLNKHLLPLADGSGTRYYVTNPGAHNHQVRLQLPPDLECSQCVFQWKYNAGNSWGVDPDGKACRGCGAQEQFYACADVAIGNDTEWVTYAPEALLSAPPPAMAVSPPIVDWRNASKAEVNIDVTTGDWYTGNLNLTIAKTDPKSSLEAATDDELLSLTAEGWPFEGGVTENRTTSSEMSDHVYSDEARLEDQILLSSLWSLHPDLLDTKANGQAGVRRFAEADYPDDDVFAPDAYPDVEDESAAPSAVDDYDYISVLQTLIDLLQAKLAYRSRTPSASLHAGHPIGVERSTQPSHAEGQLNTINDVFAGNDTKQSAEIEGTPTVSAQTTKTTSDRIDVTNGEGRISGRKPQLASTTPGTYDLIKMLRISSRTSAASP